MTFLSFLGWWALRSSVVAITTAVLLKLFRVRSPSVRLASWTAAMLASTLIPLLAPALPAVYLPAAPIRGLARVAQQSNLRLPPSIHVAGNTVSANNGISHAGRASRPFAWPPLLLSIYGLGASLLLLRVGAGLAMTRRILRRSVVTGLLADGRPVLESQDLGVPAAVGLFRPSVVLPSGWREWEPAKLDAVLVHELSHVRRRDPAVHLLSASHRALLWFSPASWWMHGRIVQLAEDASDDAVLTVTPDRVSYAELLLQFMQRGNKRFYGEGVTMARYGRGGGRILRILDSTTLSRGLTRVGATTILAIAVPAVFLAAAVTPAPHESSLPASIPSAPSVPSALSQQPTSSPTPTAPRPSPSRLPSPDRTEQGEGESQAAGTGVSAAEPASSSPDEERDNAREGRYLIVDGNSMSGSWDSRDEPRLAKWRSRYGGQFAWFRREGRDYIVTDQTVLDQLRDAMSPQKEVNAKQATVNLMQADVNRHQDKVNHLQAEVNDAQAIVNKEQEKVNHLEREGTAGEDPQSRVNQMQAEVNARQSEVNSVQDGVNREQAVVNGQQAVVNRMQERASQVIERSIHLIFDDVMSKGLAQEAE